jgi:hypothetical protein
LQRAVMKMLSDHQNDTSFFMFLGDLTNPNSRNVHHAVSFAVMVANWCADRGIHSIWLVGNHDIQEDGKRATHTLLPLAYLNQKLVHVYDEPTNDIVDTGSFKFRLIALPYTSIGRAYDPRTHVRGSVDAWTAKDKHLPLMVAGHLNIEGIEPGSESGEMARGRDVFFPVEEVDELYPGALKLNGHYHRQHHFRGIHIPGCPLRLTHGEEKNEPGYLRIEY